MPHGLSQLERPTVQSHLWSCWQESICFGVPSGKQLRSRCSAGTDNLGNTAVASKLLTAKFVLCVFLMELAVQLQTQGAELHLHWLPRLQNAEADQLTNGDFIGFCPSKRIRFCLNDFHGLVLGELSEAGCELCRSA